MQVVRIDKQMKMLDSPSIVADPANSTLTLALRSIIDAGVSGSVDMVEAMDAVLNHCSKQQVSSIISLRISDCMQLLCSFLKVHLTSASSGSFCTAFSLPYNVKNFG